MSNYNESRPGGISEAAESFGGDTPIVPLDGHGRPLPRGYLLGIDGKRYPRRPLSSRDRHGLIAHVHDLAHLHSLSVRQIQGALQDQHGIVRSVGSISTYLSDWTCADCSGASDVAPEHPATGGAA